jgi:LuxR family maltose regulon positive regulatory protein
MRPASFPQPRLPPRATINHSTMTAPASVSFALAKIQPPRLREGIVRRPALEERLRDALLTQRLVLLCAPAGFGKTTALTRQLQLLPPGTATAWVSADEDDDGKRLLGCLIAALEPYDLPWRVSPDAVLSDTARALGVPQVRGLVELR